MSLLKVVDECKLDHNLLCANVVEPFAELDHCGVLNVLYVLLPQFASVDDAAHVVMPQIKPVLHHLASKVRTRSYIIVCKTETGTVT